MTEAVSGPPTTDWEELLKTWLHDPPDKALSIMGHEERAVRYQTAALGYNPKKRVPQETLSLPISTLPSPTACPYPMQA